MDGFGCERSSSEQYLEIATNNDMRTTEQYVNVDDGVLGNSFGRLEFTSIPITDTHEESQIGENVQTTTYAPTTQVSVEMTDSHKTTKSCTSTTSKNYQPVNGHSVKRRQNASDIKRDTMNYYHKVTVCIYIMAGMAMVACVTMWLLSVMSVYSPQRDLPAWTLTILAIFLIVIAVFVHTREKKQSKELKEAYSDDALQNQSQGPIYIGRHPATLTSDHILCGDKLKGFQV